MSVIKKMLRYDKCLYWAPLGLDDFGHRLFDEPAEVGCRWEDRVEEFMGNGGDREVSSAVVYVDRDVALLGVLWHGTMATVTDAAAPFGNDGAKEIRKFGEIPTMKNREHLRTAWL